MQLYLYLHKYQCQLVHLFEIELFFFLSLLRSRSDRKNFKIIIPTLWEFLSLALVLIIEQIGVHWTNRRGWTMFAAATYLNK